MSNRSLPTFPLKKRLTFVVKSYSFCEELKHFNANLIVASFDAEPLFTNTLFYHCWYY